MTAQFHWDLDNRSWVGDMFASIAGYRIGSKTINTGLNQNLDVTIDKASCIDNRFAGLAMISAKELLDVYHQIYNERDGYWSENKKQPFYILSSVCDLIHKLAVMPLKVNGVGESTAVSLGRFLGWGNK